MITTPPRLCFVEEHAHVVLASPLILHVAISEAEVVVMVAVVVVVVRLIVFYRSGLGWTCLTCLVNV